MGFVFLVDGIYLGSVIGSTAIILCGGQAKTTKMTVSMAMDNKIGGLESGSSTSHVTPLCCTAQKSLPFVAMILVQFTLIRSVTLAKATLMSGFSQYVYMVYYQALGTILLLPWFELLVSNFAINWSKVHSYNRSFNWQFGPNFHISDCNLFEIKALGILRSICCNSLQRSNFVGTRDSVNSSPKLISEQPNWPLGCSLLAVGFLLRSIWNTLQDNPICHCFFLSGERHNKHLKHPKAFSLCVVINTLLTWCLRKKGPVFLSIIDPLNVTLAALMGFVFLADGIYLGSVIGSTAIIVVFYVVMWGQAKITKVTVSMAMDNKIGGLESGSSTSHVTPLC
ncbi:hypothetical protein V2J09_013629 [Rumex salicifolius]